MVKNLKQLNMAEVGNIVLNVLLANVKVDEIFSEIEKCVLLCSNCHNEFHYLNNKDNLTLEDFLKV